MYVFNEKIPDKQSRFVNEYMIDLNGTQAAIRAGYSKRSARSIAQEMLTKPDIVTEIQCRQSAFSIRHEITLDLILNGLVKEAMTARSSIARVRAWDQINKFTGMNKATQRDIEQIKRAVEFQQKNRPQRKRINDYTSL